MNSLLDSIKTRCAELDELFRAREYRERIMLGCMAAAGIFYALDSIVVQPLSADRAQVQLSTERTQKEILRIESEVRGLSNVVLTDDQRRAKAELDQLERQLAEIESQMGSQIADLIPPRAIVSVLEEVLASDRNLKLTRLESQTPIRLGQETNGPATGLGLYRHGLRIEIEGNFNATLGYLRRLEDSRWNLLWDRLEYRVEKFPNAAITIDLHTLSEQEEWVGV